MRREATRADLRRLGDHARVKYASQLSKARVTALIGFGKKGRDRHGETERDA